MVCICVNNSCLQINTLIQKTIERVHKNKNCLPYGRQFQQINQVFPNAPSSLLHHTRNNGHTFRSQYISHGRLQAH